MSYIVTGDNTRPPKGFHYEAGRCPLAGTNTMCNCTGQCAVRLVRDEGHCTKTCGHTGPCVKADA